MQKLHKGAAHTIKAQFNVSHERFFISFDARCIARSHCMMFNRISSNASLA